MSDTTPRRSTVEHGRLAEATGRAEDDLFEASPWYEWGPYLSERAWGTVREDYSAVGDAGSFFPHDHAGHAPTAGTRTAWPACPTSATTCVSACRCGTASTRS